MAYSTGYFDLAASAIRDFEDTLSSIAADMEGVLNLLLPPASAGRIAAAMRYAALGQGKRLRPFFVLESAALFGVAAKRAQHVAAALEMVHCYSLVHDDLPAMDNDDLRRGRPTTHRKFDEATAVLAGDGLLTLAFEVLANSGETALVIAALARAAGPSGMVGGQMLDIEAETKGFASLSAISDMQRKKTGALFEFACTAGPLMAGADFAPLATYAHHIGLAFQIADDILDVESSPEALGKATQKDKSKGKATFVDFLGLDEARQEATRLVEHAKAALNPFGAKADVLRAAADFMVRRKK